MSSSARSFAAEGLATFTLVFLGTGACVVNAAGGGRLGVVGVGAAFGAAVYLGALIFGPMSGAHMNPAVTLALWRARRFPAREVAPYVLVQAGGALAASALLLLIFRARAGDLGATHPAAGIATSFALEGMMTFVLVLVVLRSPAAWTPVAAAAVVALEAILGGPLTGASMNPARSLGPALLSGRLDGLWIYLLAPVLGALAASEVSARQ
ncbi:MAG: aquaporin [Elusimicrobia bacterium]|nr:aquaporin [Elusimicrobiota bacterium]MDE2510861.1 aquaporin [Elusimicrobiota bacterium]